MAQALLFGRSLRGQRGTVYSVAHARACGLVMLPLTRAITVKSTVESCQVGLWHAQVQGLMEVFDREWCNVFVWTPNGAALYHVPRDAGYWRACFDVLAEFWWAHVVPAKHALAASNRLAVELCRCVAFTLLTIDFPVINPTSISFSCSTRTCKLSLCSAALRAVLCCR